MANSRVGGSISPIFCSDGSGKKRNGASAGNTLEEKAKKKTFGATIHQRTKAGLLSSKLESRFRNLLTERNWLVHKSRADSRRAIHNDLEMQKLLLRLDEIADESLSILREIGALSEAYVKKHGVTEEYIKEQAKKILEQWDSSDSI